MSTMQRIIVIMCFLAICLSISGCQPAWPSGAGYVTPPTRRPSKPYEIQTGSTNWEIYGVAGGSYDGHGEIEYKMGNSMAFAIGAVITNHSKSQTNLKMEDYNGDKCMIPYGMTVKIDEYGQYIPVRYNPDLPPP